MLVIFAFIAHPCQLMATWRVYKFAEIENEDHNTLRFHRKWNGPIYAWFVVKSKFEDVFKEKLPLYRIDDRAIHNLQHQENLRSNKDTWIKWPIYDGSGPINEQMLEFMNGKILTFQYYLPDGEIRETVFHLDGVRDAINELLK
jgi:hypothetical protein